MNALHTTNDRHLAAFLVYEGADLVALKRTGPKSAEFSFTANADLHHLLRLYWSRQLLLIVPSDLLRALHRLKCGLIRRNESSPPSPDADHA